MNGTIGQVPEFQGAGDDWNVYIERLQQYFEVNGIPEDKRKALLISAIGADSYKVLRELCHPTLPKDKSFEELCELLRKQFSPHIAIFRERTNFYTARQFSYENVTAWYGRIKKLSVNCKFGDNLEKMLLDKFITGMKAGQVVDRLCEENETLELTNAVDIAVNKECSSQSTDQFNCAEHDHPFGWMRHHQRRPFSEFNFPHHHGGPHFHAREHHHPFGGMHHHHHRGPHPGPSNPHHHHRGPHPDGEHSSGWHGPRFGGGPPRGDDQRHGCHDRRDRSPHRNANEHGWHGPKFGGVPPRGSNEQHGCHERRDENEHSWHGPRFGGGPPRGDDQRHGCHDRPDRSPHRNANEHGWHGPKFGGGPPRGSNERHGCHERRDENEHSWHGPRFGGGPPRGDHQRHGCHDRPDRSPHRNANEHGWHGPKFGGGPPRGSNERHDCHERRDRSPHRDENEHSFHGCLQRRGGGPHRGGKDHGCQKGGGPYAGDRRHDHNHGDPQLNREDAHESGNDSNEPMVDLSM